MATLREMMIGAIPGGATQSTAKMCKPHAFGAMIQLAHIFFQLDEGGGTPQSGGGRGSR